MAAKPGSRPRPEGGRIKHYELSNEKWSAIKPMLPDKPCGISRNLVGRFFNRIKHCRRVARRYDKLAAKYLAFVQLASIRLWLRDNESAPWSNAFQFTASRNTAEVLREIGEA